MWGRDGNTLRQNADLVEHSLNDIPSTVILEGTANPKTDWTERLNANLGIYAQDQWTLKRLTVNYALRWEYVNEQVDGQPAQSGRFAQIPAFGAIKMPVWKTWSPRAVGHVRPDRGRQDGGADRVQPVPVSGDDDVCLAL